MVTEGLLLDTMTPQVAMTLALGCYNLDFSRHCLHVVGLHDLNDQKELCILGTASNLHKQCSIIRSTEDKMHRGHNLHMNSITAIAMLSVYYRINAMCLSIN